MDNAKKLDFIHRMSKLGLQHFDTGGPVVGQGNLTQSTTPSNIAPTGTGNAIASGGLAPEFNAVGHIVSPLINSIGATSQGIAGAFTNQNQFQANQAATPNFDYSLGAGSGLNQQAVGFNTTQDAIAQQQALAQQQQGTEQQYQNLANGVGPNPAQAALNQNTATNVANQAALMAGQRGASSNVGLLARQAVMQGANTQQQAVGQGATLQAQQQIAGLQGLTAQQQAVGATQANIAGEAQGQNTAGANLYSNSGQLNNAQNTNTISNLNNAQTINAATAQNNSNAVNKTTSGLLGGAASVLGGLLAKGGVVADAPKPADGPISKESADAFAAALNGTPVPTPNPTPQPRPKAYANGGVSDEDDVSGEDKDKEEEDQDEDEKPLFSQSQQSDVAPSTGRNITGSAEIVPQINMSAGGCTGCATCSGPHGSRVASYLMSRGGKVPAMVSPGEVYLSPDKVARVLKGENAMKIGERIPGKAAVKNDSYRNDTVRRDLDAGGIVIPRHIATHKMSAEKAELFVHRALAKKKAGL